MLPSETDPLMKRDRGSSSDKKSRIKYEDEVWWQFIHAFSFLLGGTTFVAGTAMYFYPDYANGGYVAGWLYTIGSFGFLTVDVMEFFTYTDDKWLRANIAMSAIGSTLYVIGSIGFFPSIYDATNGSVGINGFISGSAFIGVSQAWKTIRIATAPPPAMIPQLPPTIAVTTDPVSGQTTSTVVTVSVNTNGADSAHGSGGSGGSHSPAAVDPSVDRWTAAGVESSAGVGAWCFFVGTLMYRSIKDALVGSEYQQILQIWEAGSVAFTCGALFLIYRHAILRIA